MSNKERAIKLLDRIPESKMYYIIGILEGAAIPEEMPNSETIAAINEADEILESGTGQRYEGTTEDFFKALLEEQEC